MTRTRILWASTAVAVLGALANQAWADPNSAPATVVGAEGADVTAVVVTAERNIASTVAPSKASLLQTQPQSIITRGWIEQSTPETGDYTTAIIIAPSVAGVSSNGGGVGDTNTVTLRGFQDGQYNITYDGIAFGDANDTTHHPAAFFPASTLGAAVVDRGPGVAGDLGQANFGGAVHLFSPAVSDHFGLSQKATYGTFNTWAVVTTLQTGAISQLHGAKLWLDLDEHGSDSELSFAGGYGYNQAAKLVIPFSDRLQLTAFTSWNYIHYNQTDNGAGFGMGVTPQQLAAYGKNFALNNNPWDEHYYKFNYVDKQTNFNYLDLKWDAGHGFHVEDQPYLYYYKNETVSAQAANDLVVNPIGTPVADLVPSPSSATASNPDSPDIGGYHKLNRYQTYGNILRVDKDVGFGDVRAGGLVEWSDARRYIINYDLTTGAPDPGYAVPGSNSPVSYIEPSSWFQYQLFADFQWRPTDQLTLTPGIKYVDYTRSIDSLESNSHGFYTVDGSREYTKPLYFFTGNYRILPSWSVYAQFATAMLIPPVKTLGGAVQGVTAGTSPETTVTYQFGTVYTAGPVTFDMDYYHIDANNILINKTGTSCQCYMNIGSGVYSGFEAQGAYHFGDGFTGFVNGSVNNADTIKPSPGPISNSPAGTAAVGLIYGKGPWLASVANKWVGSQIGSDGATSLAPYNTVDATVSYDFGKFKVKVAAFNLIDNRARLDFDGTYNVFQVGRQVLVTLEAKFD